MATSRTKILAPRRAHVAEGVLDPGATGTWVSVFSPTGMTKCEVCYGTGESGSAAGYIQTTFADAIDGNEDVHVWDEATVSAYTVSVLAGIRSHVRAVSTSHTLSWRVSI